MIKFLWITSALFLISLPVGLLTGNMWVFALCITLWVVSVALNCYKLWGGKKALHEMSEYTFNRAFKDFDNNKPLKALVGLVVLPLVSVGILMIIISLIVLWVDVL